MIKVISKRINEDDKFAATYFEKLEGTCEEIELEVATIVAAVAKAVADEATIEGTSEKESFQTFIEEVFYLSREIKFEENQRL